MDTFDCFEEVSNCRYLFLENLSEPRANALKIEIADGRVSHVSVPVEIAGQSLGESRPVHTDESCERFELTWNSYVLYQVTDESYGKKEQSEIEISGESASIYQSSSLLEYVLRSTNASHQHPGKLTHYRMICSDHVIDVISTERPDCVRISQELKAEINLES